MWGTDPLPQALRASALKNVTLSYFTIPKSYFINYTIPFYNIPYIQKLYYFTFLLKYYFFNLSLLFLSHHHFFSAKGQNKIYMYFLAQCYSTILNLELYCGTMLKKNIYIYIYIFYFTPQLKKSDDVKEIIKKD